MSASTAEKISEFLEKKGIHKDQSERRYYAPHGGGSMSLNDTDDILAAVVVKFNELKDTKAELDKYTYEAEYLRKRMEKAEAILATIRKHMFWRNDIETVKMIDDFMQEGGEKNAEE